MKPLGLGTWERGDAYEEEVRRTGIKPLPITTNQKSKGKEPSSVCWGLGVVEGPSKRNGGRSQGRRKRKIQTRPATFGNLDTASGPEEKIEV